MRHPSSPSQVTRSGFILLPLAAAAAAALGALGACSPPGDPMRDPADDTLAVVTDALAASGPPRSTETLLVPRRASWGVDASGQDLGSEWRAASAILGDHWIAPWPEARAPLGYGESYLATTLPSGPDPAHKPPTAYFRRFFAVDAHPTRLYLRVMYDDAFVFYINGKEGGRAGMRAGPVAYGTLASAGHEAENRYVTFDISAQIPDLRDASAENTLYFEVHQADRASSDLVFDAELVAWSDGSYVRDWGASMEIPRANLWTYWDSGQAGTRWPGSGVGSISSSGPAPLGFGEDYIETEVTPGPITTYFLTRFYVDGTVRGMLADVMYDDGFVAYLNGHEVGRAYMPTGPIERTTLALGHEASGYQRFDWTSVLPYLVEGTNTLAVEVHQASASSSDLVFDLGLRFLRPWNLLPEHPPAPLHGVWFIDARRGFAVGEQGTIVATTDGGETWSARATGTRAALLAIQFTDAQHGFVGGRDGAFLRTSDGGATWVLQHLGNPADDSPWLGTLSFIDARRGWVASDGYLSATVDGGQTWTTRLLPTQGGWFESVSFADAQHGWVAGNIAVGADSHAAIYATRDGGVTWTQQWIASEANGDLRGIDAVDARTIVAVGGKDSSDSTALVLVSHDGGSTWAAPEVGAGGLHAVDLVDDRSGWAVGRGSGIVHTEDGGLTWTVQERVASFFKPLLEAVHFVDRDSGWATGYFTDFSRGSGAVVHTGTGGK